MPCYAVGIELRSRDGVSETLPRQRLRKREKNAAFGLSFVCLSARCHDIQHDFDTRHDTVCASARLLRVCVAEPEADQNRRRLTESRRARLEKEHLSRDIATTSAHACGPAPAISISTTATARLPSQSQRLWNGKRAKNPDRGSCK